MTKTASICEITIRKTNLITGPFCRTCRYHKKQRQCFNPDQLFPRGFCPHAYQAVYPYALALLYNAKYPDVDGGASRAIQVRCPGDSSYLEMKLSVEYLYPELLRKLKDSAIAFFHRLNVPAEYPDKNVIIEIGDVHDECPLHIKKGDRFKFNLFNRKELCPASFYTLYPVLIASSSGDVGSRCTAIHCPDPAGIFYDIENRSFSCNDFISEIKKHAGDQQSDCPHPINKEKGYGENICPLAFYAAFPYYWTYVHDGQFDWVRDNEPVQVQCPQANGIVMEIELKRYGRLSHGAVEASIIKAGKDCAYGYKRRDKFILDSASQDICYELLVKMISVAGSNAKNSGLHCPRMFRNCLPANRIKSQF